MAPDLSRLTDFGSTMPFIAFSTMKGESFDRDSLDSEASITKNRGHVVACVRDVASLISISSSEELP
jgi:hypothetical protein